MLQRMNMKDR